jgi:hypothetical protein
MENLWLQFFEKKITMDLVLISVSQKMEPWVLFWFSS